MKRIKGNLSKAFQGYDFQEKILHRGLGNQVTNIIQVVD
jgi:hypothetical protein